MRNAFTSHVDLAAQKQLLQLAGASSLSMKPAPALLSAGPVLVLGLEGPSHSFVRFKSYSATARSSTQLWKLPTAAGSGSSGQGGAVAAAVGTTAPADGSDWGVIASSSSR